MQAVVTARGAGTGLLERRPGSEAIERSWATTFAQAERAGERYCEPSCTAKTGTGSPLAGGLLWIGRVAAAVGLGSSERDTQGAAPLGRGSRGPRPSIGCMSESVEVDYGRSCRVHWLCDVERIANQTV